MEILNLNSNETKTSKEVVTQLVDIIFERINGESGGNKLMFMPALNIVKIKLSQMEESDADFIIDSVHQISRHIEKETGKLSPYHSIESDINE